MLVKRILLTFSLCQLCLGPIHAQQLEGSDTLSSQQEECAKKEFYTWSEEKGRCEPKQETFKARVEYQECEAKENEQERKSCMDALVAKEASNIDLEKAEEGGLGKGIIHGAFAGLGAINLISTKGSSSNCTSSMVLAGTGVAGIAAELYLKKYAKDKMEDLKKEFKDDSEKDPYATQIQSFEYLKREQETVAEIAAMRKKGYYALTAGYGIATAMAAWDIYKQNHSCSTGEEKSQKPSGDGEQGGSNQEVVKKDDLDLKSAASKLGGYMKNPWGVAVMSGIGAAYSMTLASAAGKQEKEAKSNAEEVEKLKQKLMTTLAGFCPNGHDDLKDTRCYCYKNDNTKNTDHSKSETCQMLWASDNNLFKDTSDKKATALNTTTGCVFVDGKFDETCSCKKYKNTKGNNACMKSNIGNLTAGAGLPNINTMDYQKQLNDIYSGNTSLANLDSAGLEKNAAIANRLKEDAIKKINAHKNTKTPISITDKTLKKFSDEYGKLAPKGNSFPSGSDLAANARAAVPQTIAKEALKSENKVAESSATYTKSKGLSQSAQGEDLNFSFDDSSRSSGSGSNIEEFTQKNYDYGKNDIHTRPDVSIWQVISNRYMQTGLKRLFPDEEVKQ